MLKTRALFHRASFFPSVSKTPKELLEELRTFAIAQHPQAKYDNFGRQSGLHIPYERSLDIEWPAELARDVDDVVSGGKGLVSTDENTRSEGNKEPSFSFACTACGSCCRSYVDSIMLDIPDVHRMSNGYVQKVIKTASSPQSNPTNTYKNLVQAHPEAFRYRLGEFSLETLGDPSLKSLRSNPKTYKLLEDNHTISISDTFRIPIKYYAGTVPILFLASVQKEGRDKRCAFSALLPEEAGKQEQVQRRTSSKRTKHPSRAAQARLTCTLTPEYMPYACSLYPFGDFFSNSVTRFYSVDEEGCEGIKLLPSSNVSPLRQPNNASNSLSNAPKYSMNEYEKRNDLLVRRTSAEWFQKLCVAVACGGFEQQAQLYVDRQKRRVQPSSVEQKAIIDHLHTQGYMDSSSLSNEKLHLLQDVFRTAKNPQHEQIASWFFSLFSDMEHRNQLNESIPVHPLLLMYRLKLRQIWYEVGFQAATEGDLDSWKSYVETESAQFLSNWSLLMDLLLDSRIFEEQSR